MGYDRFVRLVRLRFLLARGIHTAPPEDAGYLRRAATVLDQELTRCHDYKEYMRRYAQDIPMVG